MKSIEYLVATMNKTNEDFIKTMNIKDNILIINQTSYKDTEITKNTNQTIKFISVDEKGLSKSRNMAIENSNGDICVVVDDDFRYYDNASQKILEAYERNKDADIIAFYYTKKGEKTKKIKHKTRRVRYLRSLKINSAQITFKRESIVNNNIKFNENFGAGAEKYTAGEENIFLYECLKKGLKIYREPVYILEIEERESGSTWFKGYNKEYFTTKGAVYYQMTPTFYWILILQFAIRKRKLYVRNMKTIQAIKTMFNGKNEYKKIKNKK